MSAINDLFISYRRKNVDFVKRVVAALEASGKSVWIDWEDIPPGALSYTREIEQGIDSSHVFLAILSPDYLESPHCLAELEHAVAVNKRIVPIVYQKFEDHPVPPAIRPINWVYFVPHAGQTNDFESAYERMLNAIDSDFAHIEQHTRLLQRANEWLADDRQSGLLLRGAALHQAENWLASAANKQPPPAPIHTDFLLASRRAQSSRQRNLLAGTSVLLAIALLALAAAYWQFNEASRRADETLSLLIASDAQAAADSGDLLTAISRAHYANTFLSNAPQAAQTTLQSIGLQPAPRYVFAYDGDDDFFGLPAEVGSAFARSDDLTLYQDSADTVTIRHADDTVETTFDLMRVQSRDDSLIHPDVMDAVRTVQDNHMGYIDVGYDLSPDGRYVAMGGEGRGLTLWDNEAGAFVFGNYDAHSLIIDTPQFSRDGRYLVTSASELQNRNFGRSGLEIFVWDTRDWRVVSRIEGFNTDTELAGISDDGRYMLFYHYGTQDFTVWDTRNGAALWQINTDEYVQDLGFTADNQQLLASTVFTLRMAPPDNISAFDARSGDERLRITGYEAGHLVGLPLLRGSTPDTIRALTDEGTIQTIQLNDGSLTQTGSLPLSFVATSSANGHYLVDENYDDDVFVVYDLETGAEVGRAPRQNTYDVAVSDNANYLAYSTQDDNQLIVYALDSGEEVARFDDVVADFANNIAFAGDQWLIYADQSGILHMIDTTTWQSSRQLTGFLDSISDITYSADTQRLAVGGNSGAVLVWDTITGEAIFSLDAIGNRARVALSPDGSLLATGNEIGNIAVWRLFEADAVLSWVNDNRAVQPLSCADRVRYSLEPCG